MSDSLSRRLAALEQVTHDEPALRVIVAQAGEDAEAALRREGADLEAAQRVVVVVFG